MILSRKKTVTKAQMPEIESLYEVLEEFCDESEVPTPIRRKTKIIIDEIINNIVSYAHQDNEEHDVEVVFQRDDTTLTMMFVDDGMPFNPLASESPDTSLSAEERDIGGLGIEITKQMADETVYERVDDHNILVVTFFVDASE